MTITRMALSLVLGLAACGSGAAKQSDQTEGSNQLRDCLSELLAAAGVDTAKLQRRTINGPADESAQGSTIAEFRDSAQRRVLVVTYFGETGRTRYAYYFASRTSYLQRTLEERYAGPITTALPTIVDTATTEVFVCDGALKQPVADISVYNEGREILVEADSLLRSSRNR